jgi:hypothetical protein
MVMDKMDYSIIRTTSLFTNGIVCSIGTAIDVADVVGAGCSTVHSKTTIKFENSKYSKFKIQKSPHTSEAFQRAGWAFGCWDYGT